MALKSDDILLVQRGTKSYQMPASEIIGIIPPAPTIGDGTITIAQPGTTDQTFTVNQSGDATITLKNDNTIPNNGQITIVQPGTIDQTFTVDQIGNTTITLKNDNTDTTYSAGNGLSLSGTTFNVGAGTGITVNSDSVQITNNGVGATQLNVPGNGSSGQFLSSDGDGSFSWTTPAAGFDFPSGTVMLFYQASAPTGFTQVTTQNNKALRIVSGAGGGTGGTIDFTTAFSNKSGSLSGAAVGATTLTTSQMPSHNHRIRYATDDEENDNPGFFDQRGDRFAKYKDTLNTGGSQSHTHSITGGSIDFDLDVQHIDVILASRD